jgi:Zn finger protein HypA/HybF involved in hydrogenase expression
VHDVHAVEALIQRLRREPEKVSEVRIRATAAFSPEALEQAYEMLTGGTALEGSCLVVETACSELACPACGVSWIASADDLALHLIVCPFCGATSPAGDTSAIEVVAITGT